MWGYSGRFIGPSFAGVFGAWGGAPERGVASLRQMSRWGDTPTLTTTPRTKPLTPKEGVTDETPTMKNPPKRRGGGHLLPITIPLANAYLLLHEPSVM